MVIFNVAGGLDDNTNLDEVVFFVAAAAGLDSHAHAVDVGHHGVDDLAFVGEVGVEVGEPDAPVSGHFGGCLICFWGFKLFVLVELVAAGI